MPRQCASVGRDSLALHPRAFPRKTRWATLRDGSRLRHTVYGLPLGARVHHKDKDSGTTGAPLGPGLQ